MCSTPPKAATHHCGYSYKVSWSLMKGIQTNFKSPFFLFPWMVESILYCNYGSQTKFVRHIVFAHVLIIIYYGSQTKFVRHITLCSNEPIPIFFFFGLSRSTRCGCCSYQVSSISVRRVTNYDHFCVFRFFSMLAISMATAAILKNSTHYCTSWWGTSYNRSATFIDKYLLHIT
jgi:hypothetical protein